MRKVVDWSLNVGDGRATAGFPPCPEVWRPRGARNCLQRACKHYDQCYRQRARRRTQTAQVLVVNHALYFADLALRIAGVACQRTAWSSSTRPTTWSGPPPEPRPARPTTAAWYLRRIHKRRGERTLLSRRVRRSQAAVGGSPTQRRVLRRAARPRPAGGAQSDSVALHGEAIQETLSLVLRAPASSVFRGDAHRAGRRADGPAGAREASTASRCSRPVHAEPRRRRRVRWSPRGAPAVVCGTLDVSAAPCQHLFEAT